MAVTLIDVARRAGVSKSTVSNVIRGGVPVAAPTRERVQAAIMALGYHPDDIARSLKQRVTRTLGLVVPEPTNPFYAEVALGAARTAQERGYAVLVAHTDAQLGPESDAIRALVGRRVDGVIFGAVAEGSTVPIALLDRGIPVVLASFAGSDDPRLGVVDVRDAEAMDDVVEHLAGLGHERLAFAPHHLREWSGERRERSFDAAVARRRLARVSLDDSPTAVAAHNDIVAIRVIDDLERSGQRVPADVSVVGFDDIPLARHRRLDLTTVRQDGAACGRRAAELLLDAVARGGLVGRREALPAELVVRGSTARRRAAA